MPNKQSIEKVNKTRPIGITIFSVLMYLYGGLFLSPFMPYGYLFWASVTLLLMPEFLLVSLLPAGMLLFGLTLIILGYFLWKAKNWARISTMTILLIVVMLLLLLIHACSQDLKNPGMFSSRSGDLRIIDFALIKTIIFSIGIAYLAFNKKVKSFFSRSKK